MRPNQAAWPMSQAIHVISPTCDNPEIGNPVISPTSIDVVDLASILNGLPVMQNPDQSMQSVASAIKNNSQIAFVIYVTNWLFYVAAWLCFYPVDIAGLWVKGHVFVQWLYWMFHGEIIPNIQSVNNTYLASKRHGEFARF